MEKLNRLEADVARGLITVDCDGRKYKTPSG